jgi:hypothetical protein
MSLDAYNEQPNFKNVLLRLPKTLQLQFHLANTLIRAHKTFVDLDLITMTLQQERALDSILKMLHSQVDSIESGAVSGKSVSTHALLEADSFNSKRHLFYCDGAARSQCNAFL